MRSELTFSGKVKEELSEKWVIRRHCQIAELAAIVSMCGKISFDSRQRCMVRVKTENLSVAKKYFTILRKTFNIEPDTLVSSNAKKGNVSYTVIAKNHDDAIRILFATNLIRPDGEVYEELEEGKNPVVHRPCCKRAYLRGAFLAAGSMSNPEKSYHIEIVCASRAKAGQIKRLIHSFDLDAKVISRKNSYVVYLKEGSQVVDLLGIMEAPLSLMEMENIRILKEMRNSVNRQVNCETANINKTVSAAVKQVEDIRYIQKKSGLGSLPEGLYEIAKLRLEHPNASLKELSQLMTPPIGKSGVNHRLRKLSEIAEELRPNKEEIHD